jgi:hypothetical protein
MAQSRVWVGQSLRDQRHSTQRPDFFTNTLVSLGGEWEGGYILQRLTIQHSAPNNFLIRAVEHFRAGGGRKTREQASRPVPPRFSAFLH